MTKQVLKALCGYAVTYHSEYKFNRFVVTQHGKVVGRYADFMSSITYIASMIGNFETMHLAN